MTPESILGTMPDGAMLFQATGMTRGEMTAVAGFLSARPFGSPQATPTRLTRGRFGDAGSGFLRCVGRSHSGVRCGKPGRLLLAFSIDGK